VPFSLLVWLGALVPLRSAPAPATIGSETFSIAVNQLTEPFPAAAQVPVRPELHQVPWPDVAFAVWLIGFAAIVALRLRAWLSICRAIDLSVPIALDLGDAIDVRSSPTTLEPGIVGLWRPILLVPDGISERLTPRQLETVVAHELCHVQRRDNLTAAIHMGVEAVCWFHPLVWWIGARMLAERERACDEAVLEQGLQPRDYADAILNVCKLCVESPLACVSGVTGADLRKRLDDIITARTGAALTFVRKIALSAAAIAALAAPLAVGSITAPLRAEGHSQSQNDGQRFEVASVRPCDPSRRPGARNGGPGAGRNLSPDRLYIGCMSVVQLINIAYVGNGERLLNDDAGYLQWSAADNSNVLQHAPERIRGGPAWAHDEKFEIEAKASAPMDRKTLQGPMLRALLEERFHLKIHRAEDQNVDMFALTVAKGGPKVKPWASENECTPWDRATQKPPPMKEVIEMIHRGEKPPCDLGVMSGTNGPNATFALNGQPMESVAYWLSIAVGHHVLDRTGLSGKYTLYLEYAAENSGADATAPSVFNAVQEQWGLKLEPTKGPRGYIMIDQVERPSNSAQAAAGGRAQAQTFDAASIKPCDPNERAVGRNGGAGLTTSPGRVYVQCMSVAEMIARAFVQYGGDSRPANAPGFVDPNAIKDLVTAGPGWIYSDRYTIEASTSGTPLPTELVGPMLRALLQDRLQLQLHHDQRSVPAYALTVAKSGLKLQPVDPGTCTPPDPQALGRMTVPKPEDKPICSNGLGWHGPNMTWKANGVTMDQVARGLSGLVLHRQVVNQSGIAGQFTFAIEFARDESIDVPALPSDVKLPGSGSANVEPGASIFTVLEQQVGLKLEPIRGSQGFIVIDHVERPRAEG
jgi:uncharacterized protein (TIGR03435 family)